MAQREILVNERVCNGKPAPTYLYTNFNDKNTFISRRIKVNKKIIVRRQVEIDKQINPFKCLHINKYFMHR